MNSLGMRIIWLATLFFNWYSLFMVYMDIDLLAGSAKSGIRLGKSEDKDVGFILLHTRIGRI